MIRSDAVPLDRLLPDVRNPRRHSPENVRRMVSRIQSVGFTSPVLVDEKTGMLVAGHRRRLALLWLRENNFSEPDGVGPGWTVPVRSGAWSELQALAVLLGDNGLAEELEYDETQLAALVAELGQQDALGLAGFSQADLDALIAEVAGEAAGGGLLPGVDPDELPSTVAPRCQPGDLWALGEHRLLCGDSTDGAQVARLLAGAEGVVLSFTDPPFDMDAAQVVRVVSESADSSIVAGLGPQYSRLGNFCKRYWYEIVTLRSQPRSLPRWPGPFALHWGNSFFTNGGSHVFSRKLARGRFGNGDYIPSVLGPYAKDDNDFGYGKPIKWAEDLLWCCAAGTCVDLFAGAGTVLMACELQDRKNLSMEIDPVLCDVILSRWETATGNQATLRQRA